MEGTYDKLGNPGIFRNDRFWLAGDHVVEPRVKGVPAVQRLIASSEKARKVFKMTEYQGMNVSQADSLVKISIFLIMNLVYYYAY
jgi:hypothetical protein